MKYIVHVFADGDLADDAMVEVEAPNEAEAAVAAFQKVIATIHVGEIRKRD